MATFPNKFEKPCATCGTHVGINQGVTAGPPWVTKCRACSGTVEQTGPVVISFCQEAAGVVIEPKGRLNGEFSAYLKAVEGARFEPVRRVQIATIDMTMTIVEKVRLAGFRIDMDPSLSATLQARAAEVAGGIVAAAGRIAEVDAKLRERGLSLFPFQKTGVEWMASRQNKLLADEMGLGKTIQAITAIPQGAPVVVVAPAVAKGVWKREFAKWRPEYKITVLNGRGSFRWPTANEVVVLNYDILPAVEKGEVVPSPPAGCVLIADEAHAIKNTKAQRTLRFRHLSEVVRANGGGVTLMTATPLLNRPPELWSILQAADLAREAFGSYKNFTELFGGYHNGFGMEWGTPDASVVGPRLARVCLVRKRKEVLPELPVKTYRDITVDIDAKTAALCDKIYEAIGGDKAAVWNSDDPEALTKAIELAKSTKSGFTFETMSKARAALSAAKIPAMLELVESFEEASEPVVVFSAYLKAIDVLKGREGWAVITGETPNDERTRIEEAFQRGDLRGIGATIKAGGVAITLTRAAQAVFVDKELNPALNDQAEDRVCRIGQTRGVIITSLVADHALDARLAVLLAVKRNIIVNSVDAAKTTSATIEPSVVDFEALDKAIAEEIERAAAFELAAEEARRIAEERAREFAKTPPVPETPEEKRARRRREREASWLDEAKTSDEPRFLAESPKQKWVAASLAILTDDDPDYARVKNGAGFSKSDAVLGHKFTYLTQMVGLTAKGWGLAALLCTKYHRQVGRFDDAV